MTPEQYKLIIKQMIKHNVYAIVEVVREAQNIMGPKFTETMNKDSDPKMMEIVEMCQELIKKCNAK